MPNGPFQVAAVDDPHHRDERLVNAVEHAVVTRAQAVEREAKPLEPFDAWRRLTNRVFRQCLEALTYLIAMGGRQRIQILHRSAGELNSDRAHRARCLAR